jgi:hypothetical protein
MAPQAGTLNITFVSNNTGHRICYRLSTDPVGVYTCIDPIPACTGGGTPCSYDIPVWLDNESCDALTYEGYVQATCQDPASLAGRVAFTITFTPTEPCKATLIRCNETAPESFLITNPGSGYAVPPAAAPAATFDTGTATAIAYVADDGVYTVSIDNAGAGYADGTYTVNQESSSGAGTGAAFTVTVVGGVVTAAVPSVPLNTSIGSGYILTELITLDPFSTGDGAILEVTGLYDAGTIYEIIVNATDLYTTIPTVTIDAPPAGVTAEADVRMAPCTKFKVYQCTCVDSDYLEPELGQEFVACSPDPIPAVAGYTYDDTTGCCYSCKSMTFTPLDASSPVLTFLDCETGEWNTHTLTVPYTKCMIEDAYFITPYDAAVLVTTGADC